MAKAMLRFRPAGSTPATSRPDNHILQVNAGPVRLSVYAVPDHELPLGAAADFSIDRATLRLGDSLALFGRLSALCEGVLAGSLADLPMPRTPAEAARRLAPAVGQLILDLEDAGGVGSLMRLGPTPAADHSDDGVLGRIGGAM